MICSGYVKGLLPRDRFINRDSVLNALKERDLCENHFEISMIHRYIGFRQYVIVD